MLPFEHNQNYIIITVIFITVVEWSEKLRCPLCCHD